MPNPLPSKSQVIRLGAVAPTPDDLRKKAHVRLGERIDFSRSRHKPISLLRQEARRVLDLFFDLEVPAWPKADRDRLAEEVLGESLALGPLEELFREEATAEVMVLAHNQVIARRGEVWMPTSVHFRDPDHYRRTLARMADQGEPAASAPHPVAAIDVRLANGFRVVAVLPPAVLDQQPVAVFVRGIPGASAPGNRPTPTSAILTPPPRRTVSDPPTPPAVVVPDAARGSGGISATKSKGMIDPLARVRQRITERLIQQLASAGVFDLRRIPPAELHRVVAVSVDEFFGQERLGLDPTTRDQLTLEILAGINR
jgi:pilus assembly protein CpaF